MNWGFNSNVGGFYFDIENIKFEREKAEQQINYLNNALIKLGSRHSVFEVIDYDKDESTVGSLKGNSFLASTQQLQGKSKRNRLIASFLRDNKNLGFPRSKLVYVNEQGRCVEKYYSRINGGESPIRIDRELISFSDNSIFTTYLSIISDYNIWFEKVIDKENFDWIDNRFNAYRNTPRFNSFFRDLCSSIEQLGGYSEVENSGLYKEYITSKGILLDGEIIYQEDIEEGRVRLPE